MAEHVFVGVELTEASGVGVGVVGGSLSWPVVVKEMLSDDCFFVLFFLPIELDLGVGEL